MSADIVSEMRERLARRHSVVLPDDPPARWMSVGEAKQRLSNARLYQAAVYNGDRTPGPGDYEDFVGSLG